MVLITVMIILTGLMNTQKIPLSIVKNNNT